MPTVGDLIGVWEGLCDGLRIATTTVPCDDIDLGCWTSQTSAVACSMSGSNAIALRRSRSQMMGKRPVKLPLRFPTNT
ncbi:hypothetical protein MKI86_19880 (plasmid) [Shinella sp. B3.7]|uniref:Uncharacterized protein n=1 Tax=Shinella sedimenti TaxID=2919913 RepID=A0ABT0CSP6_9HYPH|nr:hypothetical protein [Shinella sedimenti]MCJ8151404.1 hypothetical protein [Shinella sedimenti]